MASVISSIEAHEPEHSHHLVKMHQTMLSSDNQLLVNTQVEGSTMTDQARIQDGIQASREKADIQVMRTPDFDPIQKLLAFSNDLNVSKTEAKEIIMTDEADAENRMRRTPSSISGDVQVISKEEIISPDKDLIFKLRKENRGLSKQIKEQQLTIAELTNGADLVEDSLMDTNAELQVCRKDLQDQKARFQEATVQMMPSKKGLRVRKNQLSPAQNDPKKVQQVKQELAGVRRELKASQDGLQGTYKELQKACRKLKASQEELTACKDELFRSQPIAQVPDSRVVEEFESLCQQIVNWVEAEVAMFEKAHPEEGHEHIFSIGEDNEAAQFMAQHPRGGEHLAVYMIHRWLQDNLFGPKLSCVGLPAETIQLLERVERSMARLDPPRDPKTIAAWRSETLKALANTAECEETKIRGTQDMNGRLFKELSKTLPILFGGPQKNNSLRTQILLPAVRLANTIQESTTRYAWSLQRYIPGEGISIGRIVLEHHNILDMKTGRFLKPDSLVSEDQRGVIGIVVLMVEPGLCRQKRNRGGMTLRRETLLVDLKFPLGKRHRPSSWKT